MKYTINDMENLLQNTVKISINDTIWNVFYYDEEVQIIHLYYVVDDMILKTDKTIEELSELSQEENTTVILYCLQEQLPKLELPQI